MQRNLYNAILELSAQLQEAAERACEKRDQDAVHFLVSERRRLWGLEQKLRRMQIKLD